MRVAVLVSHPIQYYSPIFRVLAERCDLDVFYAQKATPAQQSAAGFGEAFDWDMDLLAGYRATFLTNVARDPGTDRFSGCDTPEIAQRLQGGRYDALLVVGWYLKCHLQAIFAAKRAGIPVLVRGDSHLDTPRTATKRAAKAVGMPLFLRLFDAALYVGVKSRGYYRRYGFPERRLFFSPHCVDTSHFAARATQEARMALRARLGLSPQTKVALFAGKLLGHKRPLDLIEACAIASGQGAHMTVLVAGSGPLEEQMRACASALNAPLHVLGFQNQSQMPAVYAAADVLALPSSGETWGLVCNEAITCGIPIVVSDAVGCGPDLAVNGVGRIFACGDAGALAEALLETMRTPPSPESLRELSSRYSPAAAADGILSAVESFH